MQTKQSLKVQYVAVSDLKSAVYNPRFWSDEATAKLTQSIKTFGLVDPILCNSAPKRKNVVIGGHFRLKIAKDLGYKTVPVVYINLPDINKEKELNLRLNRNTGDWDYELLKDFDPTLLLDIGFDETDLSHIFDDSLEIEDDEFNVEKELAKIKATSIKPGDRFALGNHRLACIDSTDQDMVKAFMAKAKADLINTDLPYNIGLNYNGGLGGQKNYGGQINDAKTNDEYRQFVEQIITNALSVAKPDCHAFFWHDEKYTGMLQELYKQLGISQKRLCLWLKDNQNPTPNVAFNKVTELCLYGTKGKPYLTNNIKNLNEVMNKEVGTGNRLIDDVLDMLNIWLVKRLPGNQYEHPTEKNPTLYEKSLRRCSKPGDIILDLCGGSGSLLIASEQLKRTAYVAEIEPIFCQLIINRYEKYANQKAKKLN